MSVATVKATASPAAGLPVVRTLAATRAPDSPVPNAVPSESVSDSELVAAPWVSGDASRSTMSASGE